MVEGNIYGWNHGVDRPGVTSKKGRWAAGDVVFRVVFRVKKNDLKFGDSQDWNLIGGIPTPMKNIEKYESQIGSSS